MEKARVDKVEVDIKDQYDSSNWQKLPDDNLDTLRKKCFNRYVYGEIITVRNLAILFEMPPSRVRQWSAEDGYVEARRRLNKTGLMKYQEPIESDQMRRCKELFVESYEPVDLEFLADISGYSVSYLQKTSEKQDWNSLRRSFQSELRSEVRKVKIKKYAEMVSERNREAIDNQLQLYQQVREISTKAIARYKECVDKAERTEDTEEVRKLLRTLNAADFKRYVEVLDRTLEAERKLLGLDYYANHSAAVALLLSEGYAVRPRSYIIKLEAKFNIRSDDENADYMDVMHASMLDDFDAGEKKLGAGQLPGIVE